MELNYHFQHAALPEPGGERELGIMVSRLHSPALDRNRPLGVPPDRGAGARALRLLCKKYTMRWSAFSIAYPPFCRCSDSARKHNMPPLWGALLLGSAGSEHRQADGAIASLASLGRAGFDLLRTVASPGKAACYCRAAPPALP